MSVLVKGMKMPPCCGLCVFDDYGGCIMAERYFNGNSKHERAPFCPLVEVKEPHGRLIDADELWNKMSNYIDNEGAKFPFGDDDSIIHRDSACFMIECADTIIEAEGAEE